MPPPVLLASSIPAPAVVTPFSHPCPDLRPDWSDIAMDPRSTIVHIPRGAVQAVSLAYTACLRLFNSQPGWETLHRLWCFPKAVLAAPPVRRGGKMAWAALGRLVRGRADAFSGRAAWESWEDSRQGHPTGPDVIRTRGKRLRDSAAEQDRWAKRVTRLVSNAALSKAASQLTSEGVQDAADPRVWEELCRLHPYEPPPGRGPPDTWEPPLFDFAREATEDRWALLHRAVRDFPQESAPGPSGLRPDHLKALLEPGVGLDAGPLLRELDIFYINATTHGLPPGAAAILCWAKLTPLRKTQPAPAPGGMPVESTRPIAAGECLRRLVGKLLMRHHDVMPSLHGMQPTQCGVAAPGACATLAMGLQKYVCHLHSAGQQDWAVLQLDFANAFNTLRRKAILNSVARHAPPLLPWMETCYG